MRGISSLLCEFFVGSYFLVCYDPLAAILRSLFLSCTHWPAGVLKRAPNCTIDRYRLLRRLDHSRSRRNAADPTPKAAPTAAKWPSWKRS